MSQKDDMVPMEAVPERKAVRQQSGETSRGNDVTQLISSSLEEKFKSLDKALTKLSLVRVGAENSTKPKIQKIPFMLRENDNFKKYLEPRVVSIGPYHAKNSNLQVTHEIKLKLAALFIQDGGIDRNVFYEKIKEKISNFRECYADEATKCYDNNIEELAWIFLVDGCALLQYIIICDFVHFGLYDIWKRLNIKKDHIVFFQQDVFLLDNQLPYELLELLMGLSQKKDRLENLIEIFILDSINAPRDLYEKNKKNYQKAWKDKKPLHLLDLLRTTLIQPDDEKDETILMRNRLGKKLKRFLGDKVFDWLTFKKKRVWHSSFRTIDELKAAGIRLKPSETSSMKGISFSSWGTLKIPPIIVDNSTEAKLLHMAAYEMCPDFQNGFEVSTYIFVMDSLINRAQEVKALRERGILINALGSDEEVADLFNRISKDLVPNQMLYSDLLEMIQNYYNNKKLKIWIAKSIAEFIARYFHSPWGVIAFIAAILALALTIVQTVYTIEAYYNTDNHLAP
ncbi:hypothetical protein LWI28_008467 [Acer negundo]|uniref:Uncharacterized protein n=1 Tax=Acer negundo TaxID=4023 RepID=A0AAD5ICX1_ACENE|nr:hypothetical protein LWI28_008467 [Acer negundo]